MTEMADWTRAYVLMGKYGTTFIPVLLGPLGEMYAVLQGDDSGVLTTIVLEDGKIVSVLQGDDDGTLRTITLDSEGRLSAFVIDSTDAWGRMLTIGNAELAVRLGSPVHYDRRGEVVFVEDFEHGRGLWTITDSGGGADAALDPTMGLTSGYCAKLTGGTGGAGVTRILMERGIAPTGRMGLEFAFSLGTAAANVRGGFTYQDASGTWSAGARYVQATDDLEIYNDAGGWTKVDDVGHASLAAMSYNVLKVVIDLATHKYERALYNAQEIDLTAYGYYQVGASTGAVMQTWVTAESRAAQNDVVYVDDIIVTLAEPAN